jgi:hypothetical protein
MPPSACLCITRAATPSGEAGEAARAEVPCLRMCRCMIGTYRCPYRLRLRPLKAVICSSPFAVCRGTPHAPACFSHARSPPPQTLRAQRAHLPLRGCTALHRTACSMRPVCCSAARGHPGARGTSNDVPYPGVDRPRGRARTGARLFAWPKPWLRKTARATAPPARLTRRAAFKPRAGAVDVTPSRAVRALACARALALRQRNAARRVHSFRAGAHLALSVARQRTPLRLRAALACFCCAVAPVGRGGARAPAPVSSLGQNPGCEKTARATAPPARLTRRAAFKTRAGAVYMPFSQAVRALACAGALALRQRNAARCVHSSFRACGACADTR